KGSTTEYMRNRSMLVVPLRVRERPLGVLAVLNKSRGSFTLEDQQLLQAVADQGALSIQYAKLTQDVRQKERLAKELQIARDIQRRLLPDPDNYPKIPGFIIDARATSATEVGGDYFDFIWIDEDRLGIVVADVSGKGVHAALVVAMMRSAFLTLARGNPDVKDVLARVNTFMSQDLRREGISQTSAMFITCIYGILEISSHLFTWARAGHEPVIVAHLDDSAEQLAPPGFALGVIESPDFDDLLEVETIELHSGDRLLIFTDGLTEAMNVSGEEFGMNRILQVMTHFHCDGAAHPGSANGHAAPEREIGEIIRANGSPAEVTSDDYGGPCDSQAEDVKVMMNAVAQHRAGAEPSDDLTLVYLAAE
ncbi:MAG: SpoIIE family protein phosphatase, partial [Armatimonadota bacterium]|nr:SpoIIE family protein phosphatase [Armatimonadota bacterium]